MFRTLGNLMRVGDIRRKIIFTLLMLIIFRIGAFIPVPFTNREAIDFMNQQNVFGFLNTFGGGALENFSIFALGIMPYITASIIMQLLQMDVVPTSAVWRSQGADARKKLSQVTHYGKIGIAFVQAIVTSIGCNAMAGGLLIANRNFTKFFVIAIVLTGGTAYHMWVG